MEDLLIFIVWISILGHWIYLHFSFWQSLKAEDPEMYKKHSSWSFIKYSGGFAWIDLALSNQHTKSNSPNVISKGNKLRRAYDLKFKIMGLGLLVSVVIFALTVVVWST